MCTGCPATEMIPRFRGRPWIWSMLIGKTALIRRLNNLLAAHRQTIHPNRGRGHRPSEFQVAGDLRDVEEQLFQISGHGDFFHRIPEFSIRDPQPGSPSRVIASDEVHALS